MKKLLILLLTLIGCASKPLDPSVRTHVYQADYKSTLKAVIAYCQDESLPVLTVDKDLGIVNTDWKNTGGFMLGNRMKINFSLKDQTTSTKVILTITTQQQRLNGIGASASVGDYQERSMPDDEARKAYGQVFTGIQNQL